jgi:nucleoside-diphosphate-sugar epimerase
MYTFLLIQKIKIILTNILVTGATGFIGTNLIHRLLELDYNISIFIHKKSKMTHLKNITSKLDVHKIDLIKSHRINEKIKKVKPDVVYHLASYGISRDQTRNSEIINTNILGTLNLFNAILEYADVSKIVNMGSCLEYGPKIKKIKETDDNNPQSTYGFSKMTQTNVAGYFYEQKKMPINTLRVFNAYGPFQNKSGLIPNIISSTLNHKKIYINNPNDTRDFIFVNDVIEGLLRASKIKKSGEIFNIGTSNGYTVKDIMEKIIKITKYRNIVFSKNNTHEYKGKMVANITKSKNILKWKPRYTIDEGLKETFEWLKKY